MKGVPGITSSRVSGTRPGRRARENRRGRRPPCGRRAGRSLRVEASNVTADLGDVPDGGRRPHEPDRSGSRSSSAPQLSSQATTSSCGMPLPSRNSCIPFRICAICHCCTSRYSSKARSKSHDRGRSIAAASSSSCAAVFSATRNERDTDRGMAAALCLRRWRLHTLYAERAASTEWTRLTPTRSCRGAWTSCRRPRG